MKFSRLDSPIHSLLLLCVRPVNDADAEAQIPEVARSISDWEALLTAAAEHGVAPLVCERLSGIAVGDAVPDAWRHRFREEFLHNTRRNLFLAAELFRLLRTLEASGVRAIPYKGPVLAALAYGDLARRQFADLDIIVPQKEIVAAYQALATLGYASNLDPSNERDVRFITNGTAGQHSFSRAGALATVELHTEVTLRYFPAPLNWPEVVDRLQEISLGGGTVRTFSLEDTLAVLSIHGTKHFWERLCWICDVAGLLRLPQALDWEVAEQIARRLHCWKMVLLGLAVANTMVEAPLPDRVIDAIGKDLSLQALCDDVKQSFFRQPQRTPGMAKRLQFRLRSHDTLAEGIRQCLRLATQPTEDDWQAVPLPREFEPLYWLIRPWRLLRKYGLD